MISNKELKLLESWKNKPFEEKGIAEVMNLSGKKTKPWVFNALNLLMKSRLLNLRKKGNINLYSLNLSNPFLSQFLQYLEVQKSLDFPCLKIIEEILSKVPVKNYCLLVFGSYSENKQTKESDIDICILIEKKEVEKKIKPYLNEIKLNHSVKIDDYYVTFGNFVKMLLREEENLGKQIFRKHKIFFNSDIYYQLIKEAYKHGFR